MINKIKQLFQHQGFKKYFANTSWLFAEKILRMVVGFFVGVWVARYLGPDRYGLLSYAQAFVGLFSGFAGLGLGNIIIRELVKQTEKEDELLGTAFVLKLFGAALTLIILYIAVHFTSNDTYTNTLIFIIASAVIFQSFNVIDMYFQAKVMNKYVVFANSFSLLLSSLIKILLIINKAQLIYFALVVLFDNFVMASGYLYWYFKVKKEFFLRKIKFSFELAKSLLKDSWPLVFATVMISIYSRLDQVMIKEILNETEVGYYAVANKINSMFSLIPSILLISLTPAIVSAKKISEQLFMERLQRLYNIIVLYSIFIIIFIIISSKFLITFLFSNKYYNSVYILNILVLGNIFSYLGAVSSRWYLNSGFERKIFYRNLVGIVINICGNLLFIPYFGVIGAAYTTIVAQISANLIYDFIDKQTRVVFKQKIKALLLYNLLTILKKD